MEIVYALLSSIMFSATFLLIKIGREKASHLSTLWITLTINVVTLAFLNLFISHPYSITPSNLKFFILAGFFAPLLGRLFQFVGMSSLGANTTTALTLTHPLVTILIGFAFLNETANHFQLIGVLFITIGSLLISVFAGSNTKLSKLKAINFSIIYPILASLAYGTSIALRKIGIDTINSPIFASAVTVTSSWVILTLYVIFSRAKIACTKREFFFFFLTGILSSIGPIFLYLSLAIGNLVLVAPLAATTPLFVLIGTWLYSKDNENFNYQTILGTVGIVIGVSLLTLFKG